MLAIFRARAGAAAVLLSDHLGLYLSPFPPILLTYSLPLRVSYPRKQHYLLDEK